MLTHRIEIKKPDTTTSSGYYSGRPTRVVNNEQEFIEYLKTVPYSAGDLLVRDGQEVTGYSNITFVARVKNKYSLSIQSRYSDGHPEVLEVCTLLRYDPNVKALQYNCVTYSEAYTPYRRLTEEEYAKWIAGNDHLQNYLKTILEKHAS